MGETFIPNYSQSMAGFNTSTFSPSFSPTPFSIGAGNIAGINPSNYIAQQATSSFDPTQFVSGINTNMSQISPMDYVNSFNQIGTGFQSNGAILPVDASMLNGYNPSNMSVADEAMFDAAFDKSKMTTVGTPYQEQSMFSGLGNKISTGLGNIDAKTWAGLGLGGLQYKNSRDALKETKSQNAKSNAQWDKQYGLARDRIVSNRAIDWSSGTPNASTKSYQERYDEASKNLASKGV